MAAIEICGPVATVAALGATCALLAYGIAEVAAEEVVGCDRGWFVIGRAQSGTTDRR